MSMLARYTTLLSTHHNKILDAAKNYRKDAAERAALGPKERVVFDKALSSLVQYPQTVNLGARDAILIEAELGVIIGKTGKNISLADAPSYIGGYNLSIDFTDMRIIWYRQNGYGLTCAKSLGHYNPVGKFIEKLQILNYNNLVLSFEIYKDSSKEETAFEFAGNSADLVFKIEELISHLSQEMTLNEGDIIQTGTPTNTCVGDGQHTVCLLSQGGQQLDVLEFGIKISQIEAPELFNE
jgi:acylpyruvate hydrolase